MCGGGGGGGGGGGLPNLVSSKQLLMIFRGVGKGGPFLGANFIHFLYTVLGKRSVQK